VTDAVGMFMDAARRRDVRRMYELVDWGVTGAARMARALHDVEPADRADLSAEGLRELRGQPEDAFGYRLGKLALRLDAVSRIRPATESETSAVLDGFAVPAVPEGVPVPVASFLETTGRTVSGMSEVTVVELPDGDAIRLASVGDRLAL
jgi:hypothetical protein